MQGIYNYTIKTNHVSRVHNVAAILWLQFMVHVMLFPIKRLALYVSNIRIFVQYQIWLFSVVPWCRVLQVRFSGTFWLILR